MSDADDFPCPHCWHPAHEGPCRSLAERLADQADDLHAQAVARLLADRG